MSKDTEAKNLPPKEANDKMELAGEASNSANPTKMPPRPRRMMGNGGPMAMMKGEKAKNFGGTIKRLLKQMSPYTVSLIFVFILAIGSTVFTILGPRILGDATTLLFEGVMTSVSGTISFDFSGIARILITTLILYALSVSFSWINGWIMSGVSTDLTYKLRKDLFNKINRVPLKYFDSTSHGEVLSRITNDIDTINQSLSQSLTQIITSTVTVVGVLVMMFSIDWRMTFAALLIIPLSMGIVGFIVKRSQVFFRDQQAVLGQLNGHVEEMYGGHILMKTFNGEKKSLETFGTLNDELYKSAWKSQFLSGLMMPLMGFVGNVGYVAVCILGGWLAVQKAITVGDIQAFIQYIRNFTQPITQIANISNVLQQTAASAERVFEFMDLEEESPEFEENKNLAKIEGKVSFENVAFSYVPGKPVIKNFSALAKPGTKVAIVGPTGAGKTTIVKLLMRFYDLDSGTIKLDDHSINGFLRAKYRKNYAMVLQDTWLFNGTIMDNLRYGKLEARDEEVYEAARAAHADHFIRTLPEGYSMVLNEETSNISQGQKQLLTIARAILANPPVLILDEATSNVDTRTEILIQKAMDTLMQGRTSFVIAHRLSTIRNADLILVMKDGDIIEQGSHEELMAQHGFYQDLYTSQFEKLEEA